MIWTITGPSASGKTTLMKNLMRAAPQARPIQSITTRAPRPSDLAGEYEYVSHEAFERLDRDGALLWSVSPHGNQYGTRKKTINEAIFSGIHIAILVIEAAEALHEFASATGQAKNVRSLYIEVRDEDELRRRITGRGDSQDEIERRLRECLDWNERAKESPVPFYMLSGLQTRQDMAAEALVFFGS